MAYTADKPLGSDIIKDSDDILKANLTHIVAAFNAQHVWDGTTAANCVHDPGLFQVKVGTITRVMNAAGAAVDTEIGFLPQIAYFHALGDSSDQVLRTSMGGSDGTNSSCVFNVSTVTPLTVTYNSDSYCIYFSGGNPTSSYQRATCAFSATKFTLTWTASGMVNTNTAKIFYACLRFA